MTDTVVLPHPTRSGLGARIAAWGRALVAFVRSHPGLTIVVVAYVGAAVVLPTRANLAIYDDFIYIRQAQEFAHHLVVHVPDQTAANAVFEIVWGGLFGMVFGTSLWIFRLATLVLSLGGGIAMYGLCRELGSGRNGSACGAALLLFNPLFFVLSYSFMTDPHLIALVTIATYAYVRGLRSPHAARWTWAASVAASLADPSRPQGVLLPFAVAVWMLAARRLRFDWASFRRLCEVAAIPAVVVLVHRYWLQAYNGVPKDQANFVQQVKDLGGHELLLLGSRLTFVELMYLGLFLAPVAIGALLALRSVVTRMRPLGWACFGALTAVIAIGMWYFQRTPRRMPYIASWFQSDGLGPDGIVGTRAAILRPWMADALTWGSAIALLLVGLLVVRAYCDRKTVGRAGAGLVTAGLLSMVVGALPPSVSFASVISLDRYILPILPFGIALAIWACQGLRIWRVGAALAMVAMATFSVVGTHDNLEMHSAIWELGHYANSIGVPNDKLDGGAGWTRYYLAGHGHKVELFPGAAALWWVTADNRTSAQYVVSGAPIPGYKLIRQLPYSQWLQTGPSSVYLMKIPDANAKSAAG